MTPSDMTARWRGLIGLGNVQAFEADAMAVYESAREQAKGIADYELASFLRDAKECAERGYLDGSTADENCAVASRHIRDRIAAMTPQAETGEETR